MKSKKIILGSSERTVLELLWRKSPQTMTELFHELNESPGWSKSTVNTMLSRMTDKGLITFEQGPKAKLYSPCIERDAANLAETESLIDRVYQGSVGLMMNTLVRQRKMEPEEIEDLKRMLDQM